MKVFNTEERKQALFTNKLRFYVQFIINLNYANDKIQYMLLLSALVDFHPKTANKNYASSSLINFLNV